MKLIKLDDEYYLTTECQTNLCYHIKHSELLEVSGVGEKSGEVFHNKGFSFPGEVLFVDKTIKLNKQNCEQIFNSSNSSLTESDKNKTFTLNDVILIAEYVRVASRSDKSMKTKKLVEEYIRNKKAQSNKNMVDVEFLLTSTCKTQEDFGPCSSPSCIDGCKNKISKKVFIGEVEEGEFLLTIKL